ncbi:carboxylating nicotinate-nucleotide diphosphorylase [bacterium]|nr:carboxylating nicotinate-nucleotide diphosphorylase [bacterium]
MTDIFTDEVESSALSLIKLALKEDYADCDVTGSAAFKNNELCKINVVARETSVVAGVPLISLIYQLIDGKISVNSFFNDGDKVEKNDVIAVVIGPAVSVLSGERTVLNFIQRLFGIATLTARYVDEVAGTGVKIIDTRKTTPGWRLLEKYAVKCGGGVNHRFNLSDMIMFKDNHIALSGKSIVELVQSARKDFPALQIACEADTIDQVKILLNADVDIIMLDNMTIEMTEQAVKLAGRGVVLESTGGITLDNVGKVARTGVSRISIGAITHSVKSIDIGMDIN